MRIHIYICLYTYIYMLFRFHFNNFRVIKSSLIPSFVTRCYRHFCHNNTQNKLARWTKNHSNNKYRNSLLACFIFPFMGYLIGLGDQPKLLNEFILIEWHCFFDRIDQNSHSSVSLIIYLCKTVFEFNNSKFWFINDYVFFGNVFGKQTLFFLFVEHIKCETNLKRIQSIIK